MRTILTALMLTVATQAGAECGNLCDKDWWKTATTVDLHAALDAGADPTGRTDSGLTPMHFAAELSTSKNIQVLLAAGADVLTRDINGWAILHSAAGHGTPENIKVLLAADADIMARTESGRTPLHAASRHGTPENIQALLTAEVDVMARDVSGFTPLHLAARYGIPSNIQSLLTAGADVMARSNRGITPLHSAADCYGKCESGAIQHLLSTGADAKAKDNDGKTPWDYAQENKNLKGNDAYWALADAFLLCGRLCDAVWWKNASPADLQTHLDAGSYKKLTDNERKTTWGLAKKSSLKGTKAYWALNDARFN